MKKSNVGKMSLVEEFPTMDIPKYVKESVIQKINVKSLMGVKDRPEDNFKKKILIPFLKSIDGGIVFEKIYNSAYYSAEKSESDILFYFRGQLYAFEAKSKTGKSSPGQIVKHEEYKRKGIVVFLISPLNFECIKKDMLGRCV